MGLLNRAGPWLNRQMQVAAANTADTVTYTRKIGGTVALAGLAWVGRTVFSRTPNEAGAAVVWGDRDYLVPVADLAISGTTFEPARGDTITHTSGGVTATFEVMAPSAEPEARYSDELRTAWRIHAKEVGT